MELGGVLRLTGAEASGGVIGVGGYWRHQGAKGQAFRGARSYCRWEVHEDGNVGGHFVGGCHRVRGALVGK